MPACPSQLAASSPSSQTRQTTINEHSDSVRELSFNNISITTKWPPLAPSSHLPSNDLKLAAISSHPRNPHPSLSPAPLSPNRALGWGRTKINSASESRRQLGDSLPGKVYCASPLARALRTPCKSCSTITCKVNARAVNAGEAVQPSVASAVLGKPLLFC